MRNTKLFWRRCLGGGCEFWKNRRLEASATKLSIHFPDSRRREFHQMIVGIAEINALPA
jgi:hypothetical protein